MFHLLGKTVARIWPFLLMAWGGLLVWCLFTAPPWDHIVLHGESALLPGGVPSRATEKLFDSAFPGERVQSSIVLVIHREESGLREEDRKFVSDVLTPRLESLTGQARSDKERPIVSKIRTAKDLGTGTLLDSDDKKATLVVLELTRGAQDIRNRPLIADIEADIRQIEQEQKTPAGLSVDLTGSATVGRDVARAESQSADATKTWTILLVVVLLLLIYRAPLLVVIPLATVFFSVEISLRVLALLAQSGVINIFSSIQIYITVLGYGAGVDYCLFLIARYQEELNHAVNPRAALAKALRGVGAALTASAATVMCGTAMMAFADFGRFRQAGIAIPLSLLVVLCAALTFTPALLCLAGRWVFWPLMSGETPGHRGFVSRLLRWNPLAHVWEKIGRLLVRWPGMIWLGSVLVMVPFVVIATRSYGQLHFSLVAKLPEGTASVGGTRALEAHFPAGVMGTTTMLLRNDHLNFRGEEAGILVNSLTDRLQEYRQDLGLAEIRSLTAPLGVKKTAQSLDTFPETQLVIAETFRREGLKYYVSQGEELDSHVTRLELVTQVNPLAESSVPHLERLEAGVTALLPAGLENGSELHFLSPAASLRDLENVTTRDRLHIELLVPAAVFLVLVILLRKPAISLYLILSVLLSYFATLGVTVVVFQLLDPSGFDGLDWRVPIFLFTILVAVGEDYNIFLMTRIEEEQRQHGPLPGITEALSRTGGIISSCGFIMAGTFASLAFGPLVELQQMGFALAFGVLLDTLVVRPILVPAFLILIGRRKKEPHTP